MRGQRIFFIALAVSLMTHLIVAGSSTHWWIAPASEIPFPIETRLNLAVDTASQVSAASVSASVQRPSEAKPSVPALPPATEAPPPTPEPAPAMPAPATMSPSAEVVATPVQQPESTPQPIPIVDSAAPAPPRAQRNLPERIALKYSVQSGEDGFVIGQSSYSGQIRDGRYSLVSVTEATGITALFMSGKIIQTSEGRVTANGLQPEQFWSAKGEKRQPPVRFDWPQQRLLLPGGSVELPQQTQDLLSFPFHLAMLVKEGEAEWTLPVTNGRKLREYRFQAIGREMLELGEHKVETLRLQGGRNGEGSLDVWLAPARNGMPVRIRTLDQKGKAIVLTLQDGNG